MCSRCVGEAVLPLTDSYPTFCRQRHCSVRPPVANPVRPKNWCRERDLKELQLIRYSFRSIQTLTLRIIQPSVSRPLGTSVFFNGSALSLDFLYLLFRPLYCVQADADVLTAAIMVNTSTIVTASVATAAAAIVGTFSVLTRCSSPVSR